MKTVIQLALAICLLGISLFATEVLAFQSPSANSPPENSDQKPEFNTDHWETIAPTGARASFRMPKKPRYVERSFSPVKDEPPIKVRVHMTTVNEGLTTYIFGYHDLHEQPANQKIVDDTLNGAIKGSVANVLGQLLADPMKIKYTDNNMGREFVYACTQNEKKFIVTSRVFLVNRRQYQLTCLMEESVFDQDVANGFLDSFTIIKSESDLPPRPKTSR